jgi:hypothetical protein
MSATKSDLVELSGKRLLINGIFYLIPRRLLKKRLKGLGAIIAPAPHKAPRIDAIIAGSGLDEGLVRSLRRQGVPVWDEVSLAEALGLIDGHGERMGRLRGLCYSPQADAQSWRALCEVLEFWPEGEGLWQGVAYVRSFLDRWSIADSRVPARWFTRAANGTEEPRLALARYADMGLQWRWRRKHLRRVMAQLPEGVTALRLCAPRLYSEAVVELLKHPRAASLRHLSLPWTPLYGGRREEELALLRSGRLGQLQGLDLRGCHLRVADAGQLRAALPAGALLHDPGGRGQVWSTDELREWLRAHDYVF